MAQLNIEETKTNLKAKKFLMWLFLVSSFIYFAGLTSGFIVYTAGSANRGIKTILPEEFMYSTAAIILSSLTMHLAVRAGKGLRFGSQQLFLALTFVLGIVFFVIQWKAWNVLASRGIMFSFNKNASQSFVYVFVWSHLAHILAGLGLIVGAMLGRVRNIAQIRNVFRLEITSIFWHFIDILWIYLYVFLLLNQ
ncbi:cytochrome c oxidase subunit 3 [Hufsiella ginkgonis]|uniref:Heme-copper oxidase subunit III n=1 Tax=Hufsiella ginkgonis TaxID=2695274 RepID=A0A7K1Y2W0_9SPHI|nr:cytochrome c oxidase subunit 3 [Hufsiella ginkgonis]MXV17624.1 heme-copper oxidase subunit III [Hufsiella ginkgonis]